MILENASGIIELLIIAGAIVISVKMYVTAETDKQLEKARIYADRDIRTANIESNTMNYGFNEPTANQEGDTISQLIGLAVSNPQILQSLLSKGGGAGLPASFQNKDSSVLAQNDNKIK